MRQRKRVEEPRLQTLLGTIWRISILLVFLSACSRPEQGNTVPESQESVDQIYANPSSLIEPEAIQLNINLLVNTFLIDVRKPSDFDDGHIAGSINVWRNQITDTSYNYGGMMARKGQMEQLLSELGVIPSDTLILYDAKANVDAARLWWILKYYGHKHVRLLNGGLKNWQDTGGALDTVKIEYYDTKYKFEDEVNSEIQASIQTVKSAIEKGRGILVDTRSKEEFFGELQKKGAARAGAIPSSVNLDWSASVNYEGNHRFRPVREIEKIYGDIGINESTEVITYCHSGVRSAHTLFVLKELLGYGKVQNYDGSWTEWSHIAYE